MNTTYDIDPITGFDKYNKRRWLSVSSLCSFSRCPRLFFYGSGCRMRPIEDNAIALTFGGAMHAGLGYATQGHDVPTCMAKFAEVWKDNDLKGDTKRNSLRAASMFASFKGHIRNLYRPAPPQPVTPGLKPRNSPFEVPFAIDIGVYRTLEDGTKEMIPLVGWIDDLALSVDDGQECIVEYKTASEVSSRFFSSFNNSPQLVAYVTAMRIMGKKIPRCYITALRVSEKNTETLSTVYNITDAACDDFISWARYTGNLILAHEDMKSFPKDVSACFPYPQFGSQGYPCRFHDLCHLTKDWTHLSSLYNFAQDENFVLFED